MRVFFARHGETDLNRELRLQGNMDMPLNAVGLQQAAALGARIAKEAPDAELLVTSPLVRAVRTADAIADAHPRALRRVTVDGIREISFGSYDGKSATTDEFRAVYARWESNDLDAAIVEDAETPAQVLVRAWPALLEALRDAAARDERCVVVVGHGRCLRLLIARALGLPMSAVQLANTALSLLTWHPSSSSDDDDGRFEAVFINSTDHVVAAAGGCGVLKTMSEVLAESTKAP